MFSHPLDKLFLIFYATSVLLFSYVEGKTAITKVAAITLAALFFYRAFQKSGFVVVTREFVLVAVWLGLATVSALFAKDQGAALAKLFTLLQVIPASYIVFCLLVWIGSAYAAWAAILVATVGMSIPTFLNPAMYSVGDRLTGMLGNANLYGLALLMAIVISVHFISVYKSIIFRLLVVALLPFLFYMLLQTGSRKAMVGVVLILILIGYGKIRVSFKQNMLRGLGMLALGVVLLGSSVYYITQSTFYHRFETIFDAAKSRDISKAGSSLRGRVHLYEIGLEVAAQHPVLGVGLNNFRSIKSEGLFGSAIGGYAHSNYVEILVSTGVIGFIIYFSIYGSLFFRLLKLRKKRLAATDQEIYIVTFPLLVTFAIYDLAMVSFYEKASWLILASIMASVYLLESRARGQVPSKNPVQAAKVNDERPVSDISSELNGVRKNYPGCLNKDINPGRGRG